MENFGLRAPNSKCYIKAQFIQSIKDFFSCKRNRPTKKNIRYSCRRSHRHANLEEAMILIYRNPPFSSYPVLRGAVSQKVLINPNSFKTVKSSYIYFIAGSFLLKECDGQGPLTNSKWRAGDTLSSKGFGTIFEQVKKQSYLISCAICYTPTSGLVDINAIRTIGF